MENSSTSVSASSTAFMPLVQSRLSQNMQFTWVTHLFLKLAFEVDIVVLLNADFALFFTFFLPPDSKRRKGKKNQTLRILTNRSLRFNIAVN